ncbi:MAG: polysaccharide pyruvyl transferase CsaB [Clostridiaceae bacterium]|nr:polysaccharide pyruvyl transferase CsaB [Clostridiaceae bacterium]
MYDVMISGYYGFKNSGDDAILLAIINDLRNVKNDIRIVVLSKTPKATSKNYGVDSVDRFNLFEVMKAMKKTRLFLNGGGNLIQDVTSTRSLFYYLATIYLAKLIGLKVMLYANGIGPVSGRLNRYFTSKIINLVDVITLREEASRSELEALGIGKPEIIVTADPALGLAPAAFEETQQIFINEGIPLDRSLVGFSIRKWAGYEVYSRIIAQAADYMEEKYNVKPVFIPMHFPSDLSVAEDIASKMEHAPFIIRNMYSIDRTLGIIKKLDLIFGMRLHALIYAVSLSVPVIGLIYDPKIQGFLEYVKQPSAGNVADLELKSLKKLIDEVWSNKAAISQQLEEGNRLLKRKAYENAEIAIGLLQTPDARHQTLD